MVNTGFIVETIVAGLVVLMLYPISVRALIISLKSPSPALLLRAGRPLVMVCVTANLIRTVDINGAFKIYSRPAVQLIGDNVTYLLWYVYWIWCAEVFASHANALQQNPPRYLLSGGLIVAGITHVFFLCIYAYVLTTQRYSLYGICMAILLLLVTALSAVYWIGFLRLRSLLLTHQKKLQNSRVSNFTNLVCRMMVIGIIAVVIVAMMYASDIGNVIDHLGGNNAPPVTDPNTYRFAVSLWGQYVAIIAYHTYTFDKLGKSVRSGSKGSRHKGSRSTKSPSDRRKTKEVSLHGSRRRPETTGSGQRRSLSGAVTISLDVPGHPVAISLRPDLCKDTSD